MGESGGPPRLAGAVAAVRGAAGELVARRPVSLWLVLAAANAVFLPYQGFAHDAQLYAGSALNWADPGCLGEDLFFRYGSQDRFTVFTPVSGLVVRAVGIHLAFALLYAGGTGLYLWAVIRVVRRLVPDPVAALGAMVFVSVEWLPFGGQRVFHVFEPFLTSRLFAVALGLFAAERALAGRWGTAAGLAVAGFVLHPLMGFGGVLLVVGLALTRVPAIWAGAGLAVAGVATAGVLLVPAVGEPLLGTMDADWRGEVRALCSFNFASEWYWTDWVRIAGAGVVLVVGAVAVPGVRAVAGVAVVLAVLGAGGTAVAEALPYAVPVQGQPYRALWVAAFFQVPLGFAAVARWAHDPRPGRPLAAALLLAWLFVARDIPVTWLLVLSATAVGGMLARQSDPFLGALAGTVAALTLAGAATAVGVSSGWRNHTQDFDLAQRARILIEIVNPAARLAVCFGLVLWVARWPRTRFACAGVAVLPLVVFGPGAASGWVRSFDRDGRSVGFVGETVATEDRPGGPSPCVYWPKCRLHQLWVGAGAASYLTPYQLSGSLFYRGTAVEGRRRLRLVRRFELDGPTTGGASPGKIIERVYELTPEEVRDGVPPPTATDLWDLCADPALDWVVVERHFPEFAPATDGRVFLYDARRVRATPRPAS